MTEDSACATAQMGSLPEIILYVARASFSSPPLNKHLKIKAAVSIEETTMSNNDSHFR